MKYQETYANVPRHNKYCGDVQDKRTKAQAGEMNAERLMVNVERLRTRSAVDRNCLDALERAMKECNRTMEDPSRDGINTRGSDAVAPTVIAPSCKKNREHGGGGGGWRPDDGT